MTKMLCAIEWNPSAELFSIGSFAVRYYSFWWLVGLVAAYFLLKYLYKQQQLSDKDFDSLVVYSFIGIFVGARLGHFLFYDPEYFITRPLEIILPIARDAAGKYHFVGYAGLASHGGTLGLMLALWMYARKTGMNLWQTLDNIAIATPITACCIRLGNFWNSEIIGNATGSDWGIIFTQVDNVARHPSQLYEAIAYIIIFVVGLLIYKCLDSKLHRGFYFGFCLTAIFTARFFIEFSKVNNGIFEDFALNTGHYLSVPFIALGLFCMFYRKVGSIELGTVKKKLR